MVLSFALCAAELDLGDEINDSSYVQGQMMHNRRSLRVVFEALALKVIILNDILLVQR